MAILINSIDSSRNFSAKCLFYCTEIRSLIMTPRYVPYIVCECSNADLVGHRNREAPRGCPEQHAGVGGRERGGGQDFRRPGLPRALLPGAALFWIRVGHRRHEEQRGRPEQCADLLCGALRRCPSRIRLPWRLDSHRHGLSSALREFTWRNPRWIIFITHTHVTT